MAKNIAFIFSEDDLSSIDVNKFLLCPVSDASFEILEKRGLNYLNFEDFYDKKEKKVISNLSKKFANNWYIEKNGVLSCFNLSLDHYFSKRIYLFNCIINLLKKYKPSEIFLGSENKSAKGLVSFDHESLLNVINTASSELGITTTKTESFGLKYLAYFFQFFNLPRITLKDDKGTFSKKVKFVFLASDYHVLGILPLLLRFRHCCVVVGHMGNAKRELIENKIPFVDIKEGISLVSLPTFFCLKIISLFTLLKINKNIFKYKEYDLFPIFKEKLVSVINSESVRLELIKKSYKYFFITGKVSAVVTLTNSPEHQYALKIAQQTGINTFEIQHGLNFGHDNYYQVAKKFIAWGEIPKRLSELYAPKGLLVVTAGWPGFDGLVVKNIPKKNLNDGLNILFLFHNPEGFAAPFITNNSIENFNILLDGLSELDRKVFLTVRMHPRSSSEVFASIAKKYSIAVVFNNKELLLDQIKNADIVVGQTTTATLYALFSGKPTLYFASMRWPAKFLEGEKCVFVVNKASDFKSSILEVVSGKRPKASEIQSFFVRYCGDVNPSEKIYNILTA